MIAHVCERGGRLRGLIEYLYGRGKSDEHTNPHLVAAWEPSIMAHPQDRAGRGWIAEEMSAPRRLFGVEVPEGPVYHVSISVSRDEGLLGDQVWRTVAERAADKLGFTARDGRAGCRWIAVHHGRSNGGNDHIHLVADVVREDGTTAELGGDWFALGEMATEMEREFGLTVLVRNKRGERGLKRAELAAAQRRDRAEPDRTALARRVRAAAAAAGTEAEFVTRLRQDGLLLRPRWASGQRATRLRHLVGYSVAVRADAGQTPIWYGGGKLGRDLSLPALRQRWATPSAADEAAAVGLWRPRGWRREGAGSTPRPRVLQPMAWEVAGEQVAQTRRRLATIAPSDRAAWASAAREASGVLAAAASRLQPGQRRELAHAADALARAGQLPRGERRGHRDPALAALGGVARVAIDAALVGRGGALATMVLVGQLAELATEIGRAHAAGQRASEAAAGAAAAEQALAYLHTGRLPTAEQPDTTPATRTSPPRADPERATTPGAQHPGMGARPTHPRRDRADERGRG